ncbi:MAG: NAD(+)/NADH kinase [Bacilli bacterium]|nr:NAD(+)/NADH kinase [Bacilli bacterium]
MRRNIKKIKLFINNNDKSREVAETFEKKLINNGFIICDNDFDLAIAIGGDGSFLRMIKENNFNSDIYYVGINAGTLGFLQEVKINECDEFINDLKNNNFKVDYIGVQETNLYRKNECSKFYSLNEIVIRDKDLNTTKLEVKIEDDKLEDFIGDGLLISTSIGSTAYNLSFGGSIVYNSFHTLQITPIAPLNTKVYRSLVNSLIIPDNKEIVLIPKKENKNLIVTIDGENNIYDNVDCIRTVIKDKRIRFLRLKHYNFPEKINEKFLND